LTDKEWHEYEKDVPDPDNFLAAWRGLDKVGTCIYVIGTVYQLLARSCQSGCHAFVPRIYEFSRLGEKHLLTRLSPGERQKLITFPITAEKSHILIFNSPPLGVSRQEEGSKMQ